MVNTNFYKIMTVNDYFPGVRTGWSCLIYKATSTNMSSLLIHLCFIERNILWNSIKQLIINIISTQLKFCLRYGISVSQMTTDVSTCRKHFPVLSSFMTYYHRLCNYINTTGVTSGPGATYPSGATEFIPDF